LFFHWVYIPGWDLTSSLIFSHFSLDCTLIPQFLHPTLATSHSNSSHHLGFGLPLLLSPFPSHLVQRNFFAGPLPSILITCPSRLSLPNLIKCTTSCSSSNLYISDFSRLLQHPFSTTWPIIFRRTFLSKDLFTHSQISEPSVCTGLFNVTKMRDLTYIVQRVGQTQQFLLHKMLLYGDMFRLLLSRLRALLKYRSSCIANIGSIQ
jgi:hypothetical protein